MAARTLKYIRFIPPSTVWRELYQWEGADSSTQGCDWTVPKGAVSCTPPAAYVSLRCGVASITSNRAGVGWSIGPSPPPLQRFPWENRTVESGNKYTSYQDELSVAQLTFQSLPTPHNSLTLHLETVPGLPWTRMGTNPQIKAWIQPVTRPRSSDSIKVSAVPN